MGDTFGRLDEKLTDEEYEFLCSHLTSHLLRFIVFRQICDDQDNISVFSLNSKFQETFLTHDFLENFVKNRIENQDVTSILNIFTNFSNLWY